MKNASITLLTALCALSANAADYYLIGGDSTTPLNAYTPANWNDSPDGLGTPATAITVSDTLYLRGNAFIGDNDQFTTFAKMYFENNGTLTMNGQNAKVRNDTSGDNTFGAEAVSNATLQILGKGNSFEFNAGVYAVNLIGAEFATSGDRLVRVHSSDALSKNTLLFTGSTQLLLSSSAGSTATATLEIGDYSDVTVLHGSFRVGETKATPSVGGSAFFNMKGTGSSLTANTLRIAGGASDINGGTSHVLINGTNNKLNLTGLEIASERKMTSGKAIFELKGSGNVVAMNGGVNIGRTDNTGGTFEFELSGDSNIINMNGNFNVHAGAKVTIEAGNSFTQHVYSSRLTKFYAGSTLELIANEDGFLAANGTDAAFSLRNMNQFDGILILDFSNYIVDNTTLGDQVKVMYAYSETYGITADELNNGYLDGSKVIIKGGEIEAGSFEWRSGDLYVTVLSTIPEPSTYAAIFGALALAFAAYRRRG
jgi:PEP-CTERM putative exosortase interaction domain